MKIIYCKPIEILYAATQQNSAELLDYYFTHSKDIKVNCFTEHRTAQQLFDFAICSESAISKIFTLLKTSFFRLEGILLFQKSYVDVWSVTFNNTFSEETFDNLYKKGGQNER